MITEDMLNNALTTGAIFIFFYSRSIVITAKLHAKKRSHRHSFVYRSISFIAIKKWTIILTRGATSLVLEIAGWSFFILFLLHTKHLTLGKDRERKREADTNEKDERYVRLDLVIIRWWVNRVNHTINTATVIVMMIIKYQDHFCSCSSSSSYLHSFATTPLKLPQTKR